MLKLSYIKTKPRSTEKNRFKTFVGAIDYFSKSKPDSEAVVFELTDGSREAVSWRTLCQKSKTIAKCFIELSIQHKELVAINVRQSPEWMFVTFGAMYAGAIPVSISLANKDGSDVIALMQKLGRCAMIIFDPGENDEQWSILSKLLDDLSDDGKVRSNKLSYLRHVIFTNCPKTIETVMTLKHLLSTPMNIDVALPDIADDDVAALFQTSGSTGIPKFVAHTHRSFFIGLTSGADREDLHPDLYKDVIYNDRPFDYIGGFPYNVWFGQTRVAISGKCPPPVDKIGFMIDVIRRERCAIMFTLPPMVHELEKRKDEFGEDWPLKCVITGGIPITKSIAMSTLSVSKSFVNDYGSAEIFLISEIKSEAVNDFEDYSTGFLTSGIELKIVDNDGEVVPVLTTGVKYVRSEGIFNEYWNDSEKTKAVKTDDGWYNTDDIGKLDEDGILYVFGRKSNMIVSGGINVAPEMIENAMKSCPDVDAVVAVPVPDDAMCKVVCACVVLRQGRKSTEQNIRSFNEELHTNNKGSFTVLPKNYMILESFPETSSGKYSRPQLTAMAIARFKS